jgi:hypothetical protein
MSCHGAEKNVWSKGAASKSWLEKTKMRSQMTVLFSGSYSFDVLKDMIFRIYKLYGK